MGFKKKYVFDADITTPVLAQRCRDQDAAFQAAMLAAIERKEEHCPTSPSTRVGTKNPITGYDRND
jgi:hypothetical protein